MDKTLVSGIPMKTLPVLTGNSVSGVWACQEAGSRPLGPLWAGSPRRCCILVRVPCSCYKAVNLMKQNHSNIDGNLTPGEIPDFFSFFQIAGFSLIRQKSNCLLRTRRNQRPMEGEMNGKGNSNKPVPKMREGN